MDFSDTLKTAKDLLGCTLVFESPEGVTSGVIVETEAYLADDPACHASRGMTAANKDMFGSAATSYVYFTYGMHYCLNIVTAKEGVGEAVLIRAVKPVKGVDLMKKRRKKAALKDLCSGPAKLTQAFAITTDHSGLVLNEGALSIIEGEVDDEIVSTTRVGISRGVDLLYRFYLKDSEFISKK